MCTAAAYQTNDHYFGRNLDYDISYGEEVCITPRNFPFTFRYTSTINSHYAIIGIAYVPQLANTSTGEALDSTNSTINPNEYPLYYDAINEKGLGIAGLNFVGNATYYQPIDGQDNIAQFELIPWILSQCATIDEAKVLFSRINLTDTPFNNQLPVAELHWILSDTTGTCVVVESVSNGLKIHDNPIGILTNNPPFDKQLLQLSNYQHLSAQDPENKFAPDIKFNTYSRGMGGIGLPGDLSSESRFAKAAFTKLNSLPTRDDELSSVSQFFHILGSVDQQNGCCDLGDHRYEHTLYTSCYNLEQGIFYYTTYNNHQISATKLHNADLNATTLTHHPIIETEQVNYLN